MGLGGGVTRKKGISEPCTMHILEFIKMRDEKSKYMSFDIFLKSLLNIVGDLSEIQCPSLMDL